MRTDRELLELAAKAGGVKIDLIYTDQYPPTSLPHGYLVVINASGGHSFWNPLEDDGDALRLAVKLQIDMRQFLQYRGVVDTIVDRIGKSFMEAFTDDPYAATRRAIVRAAAEIGAASPDPQVQEQGEKQ